MPYFPDVDTRVDYKLLDLDRRTMLPAGARLEFLKQSAAPEAEDGFLKTGEVTKGFFLENGEEAGENIFVTFKAADLLNEYEAILDGIDHIRMLGRLYKLNRDGVRKPLLTESRVWRITTSIKKNQHFFFRP